MGPESTIVITYKGSSDDHSLSPVHGDFILENKHKRANLKQESFMYCLNLITQLQSFSYQLTMTKISDQKVMFANFTRERDEA